MNRRRLITAAILGATLTAGASLLGLGSRSSTAATPAGGFPTTVTDDLGRHVTLSAAPKRIVCLSPAHTETLYALGVQDRIVAVDTYSDFPAATKSKPKLNCWPHPPYEQIVSLRPDLVIVLTEGAEAVRQLEALHLTVVKLFPPSYPAALQRIRTLGTLVGAPRKAEQLVRSLEVRTRKVEKKVAGAPLRTAMFELDASDPVKPFVAGGHGLYNEVIRKAGGKNVFDDMPGPSPQVSAELIVARNPEVILLADTQTPQRPQNAAALAKRPGWSGLTAVRSGRVFPVDGNRISRPGPRLVEGLEQVAKLLHPERFR